jgi:hypothetical protein
MNMTLNRDYVLATNKGHSIAFKKDVPTHVPGIVYQNAIAIGAVPSDGDAPNVLPPEDDEAPPITDADDRTKHIMGAIEKLVARNERGDFTAAGAPAVDAVFDLTGFRAQAKEIAVVWQAYRDAKAEK